MAKKASKARVGKAAANNKKVPKRNASAVAKGAAYAVLAGRPSKQAVIAVFGKTGYALFGLRGRMVSGSCRRSCATDSRRTPPGSRSCGLS
jgi:hypothetical protein